MIQPLSDYPDRIVVGVPVSSMDGATEQMLEDLSALLLFSMLGDSWKERFCDVSRVDRNSQMQIGIFRSFSQLCLHGPIHN